MEESEYVLIADLEDFDGIVVAQVDWEWWLVKLITVEIHVHSIADILKTSIYNHLNSAAFQMEHFVQASGFSIERFHVHKSPQKRLPLSGE